MPRIGTDEWVEGVGERTESYQGFTAPARQAWDRVGPAWQLAGVAAIAAAVPFLSDSDFVIRVAVNALLFALLALGLNIVVGWAGMLDLGYVAFYGFGAYSYAWVSSSKFDIHWPTELTIPAVVLACALLGLLLGLPSRRLIGDYLAITTLFFAQVFVELALNLDRLQLPWTDRPINLTGGPNGIPGVDPMRIFGLDFLTVRDYFYLALVVFVLVVIGLHFLDSSRTGRAWRALREDPLAAEHMTIPVDRLRLLAFAFGAGMAGLAGTIFAAVQVGVFPQNFEVILLIMIYAALILGGAGSIRGAVLGAVVIAVFPEILRNPDNARWLFYGVLLVTLLAVVRPWQRLAALAASVVAFGFVLRFVVGLFSSEALAGELRGGFFADVLESWLVMPGANRATIGNLAFVLLVASVLALTQVRGWVRTAALVPVLYLAVFVWENRLIFEPSVTRQLVLGAILVVMMTRRPHGLLGTPRVESPA